MDGKFATLAGAAALIAAPAMASAAPHAPEPAVPVAASYAELLNPIPNASERLRLADAQGESAQLIEAQYVAHHHHHHHHHHHYTRRWHRHHYGYGGRWHRTRDHHHHHHHHHNTNY